MPTIELLGILRSYLADGTLVTWRHCDEQGPRSGVVVACSERLVVFQSLADTLELDGYAAVPLACLTSLRASGASESTLKYLASKGQIVATPTGLEGPELDLQAVLAALDGKHAVFHPRDDVVLWIGPFTLLDEEVRVHTVDLRGRPMGDEVLPFAEIALIAWDTAYVRGVQWMGANDHDPYEDDEEGGPPWFAEVQVEALVPPTVPLVPVAGETSTYAQAMAAHAVDDEPGMVAGMRTAAAEGDPRAIYALATWSLDGSCGAELDPDAAGEGLRIAADAGVVEAMCDRALWLEDRAGPQGEVFRGYLRAALRGDTASVSQVARCFEEGVGVHSDPRAAAVWCELARDGFPRPPRKARGAATDPSRAFDGSWSRS